MAENIVNMRNQSKLAQRCERESTLVNNLYYDQLKTAFIKVCN